MSFFESQTKERTEFKKPSYMQLTSGSHTIRVLQTNAKGYFQHWLGGPVECLGDDCPQCQLNKKLIAENNNDFNVAKKIPGFNWRQERAAVNVLDRTPVKICPQCQTEIKAEDDVFSASCPSCGHFIQKVPAKPLNEVKIFSRAASVFQKLDLFDKSTLDEDGEKIGLTNFDVELLVSGNTTIPRKTNNFDEIEVDDADLYDLDMVVMNLTPDEMSQRMRGVSFKDIFAARRAGEDTKVEVSTDGVAKADVEKVKGLIDELFAD